MHTPVADETEIGGRCEGDAGVVKWGPGNGVMSKAWGLQRSGRCSEHVHRKRVACDSGPACPRTPSEMRVSVPTIPRVTARSNPVSPAAAIERIASFLASGNVTLLTGAGVSVDSGIRAYRGKDGRYMNPNYRYVIRSIIEIHPPTSLKPHLCTRTRFACL